MTRSESISPVHRLKAWLVEDREKLLVANVSQIVATYSGSGDEGMYEGIHIIDEQGHPVEYSFPEGVETLIETAIDTLAPYGYENNEGGGGEVRLSPSSGMISHQSYFVTTEYNNEETYQWPILLSMRNQVR